MQNVLLKVYQVAEQSVVVVLDQLCCYWSVRRIQTCTDSATDDSFDTMSIICRREAPPGAGRVEQFGEDNGSVHCLQTLVVHTMSAQYCDYMQ